MKRVTITLIALSFFTLAGCAQRAVEEGPVAVKGTASSSDPCAEYVVQGTGCEYLAFPEMEIRAQGGAELAGVQAR
ncbi:MAG TPA: hypothetical protein PK095_07075 [Myxococcota bacterium]|nr:hypothetical protein [Myxococcota bacterium]